MPYGGPRFEFFTQNQYNNHTAFILKEDAARAAAIQQNREDAKAAESRQERLKTEQMQHEAARIEQAAADKEEAAALRQRRLAAEERATKKQRQQHRRAARHTQSNVIGDDPTKNTSQRRSNTHGGTQFTGSARVLTLTQPKQRDPAYGSLMYGKCMYQRGETVQFPTGRNGQPYTPGIDRDRTLPARPDTTFKPWEGSYSTQRPSKASVEHHADHQYYLSQPKGASSEKQAARRDTIATLSAFHAPQDATLSENPSAERVCSSGENTVGHHRSASAASSRSSSSSSAPSVFSHCSSNGPIEATGTMHMVAEPRAGKEQVSAHLKRYGGAMTASGNKYSVAGSAAGRRRIDENGLEVSPLIGLSLPELSYRVVTIQGLPSQQRSF